MLKKVLVATAALALSAVSAHAGTVVLVDNFDSDAQTLNWPGDAVFTSQPPPGNVDGLPSVDLIGTGGPFDFQPGHGNYVDLDGSTAEGNTPAGDLVSNAPFGAGTYDLSFLLAGNLRGTPAQTLDVLLGSTLIATLTPSNTQPFTHYNFVFSSSGGNLEFKELGPADDRGNLLDNVTLIAGVPEPASWALMILGVGAIGGALRLARRREDGAGFAAT